MEPVEAVPPCGGWNAPRSSVIALNLPLEKRSETAVLASVVSLVPLGTPMLVSHASWQSSWATRGRLGRRRSSSTSVRTAWQCRLGMGTVRRWLSLLPQV